MEELSNLQKGLGKQGLNFKNNSRFINMAEEKKQAEQKEEKKVTPPKAEDKPVAKVLDKPSEKKADTTGAKTTETKQETRPSRVKSRVGGKRPGKRDRKKRSNKDEDGFANKMISVRRVTRMFKGGRRLRLSVMVVVGDQNGKVGVGLGKGEDVRSAQEKAINAAKKNLIQVPITGNTIPHQVFYKKGASKVLMKPAAPGTGIVAGSSMRMVAEMAGIKDVLGKIIGRTSNNVSNAYATIEALKTLRETRL
jgi:small subunit ribosomal protein S5